MKRSIVFLALTCFLAAVDAQLALDQQTATQRIRQYHPVSNLLLQNQITKRDAGPSYWRWPVNLGYNQTVHLLLTPNTALTEQLDPAVRAQIDLQPHTFLSGEVEGYPAPLSSVSLSVKSFDEFVGRITVGDTVHHLELLRKDDGTMQVVSYRGDDLQDDPEAPMHCLTDATTVGHDHTAHVQAKRMSDTVGEYEMILPTAQFRLDKSEELISAAQMHTKESHAMSKRALSLAPGTTPSNVDCPMYLVSDYAFTRSVGGIKPAIWTMLSILNDVSTIYLNQYTINLPVYAVYAVNSTSDQTGLGYTWPAISTTLNNLAAATYNLNLPNYRTDTCVVHMFTSTYYSSANNGGSLPVGLAYLAQTGSAGGICDRNGYNCGVTTNLARNGYIPRSNQVIITAHEIGHNFGSVHDGTRGASEPTSCKPSSNPFIMWPSFSGSSNSNQFSTCSQSEMNTQMQNRANSCFYPRGAIAGQSPNSADQPTAQPITDNCPQMQSMGYFTNSGQPWAMCTSDISSSYSCTIICKDSGSSSLACATFANPSNPNQALYKADGAVCGPLGQTCLGGVCQVTLSPTNENNSAPRKIDAHYWWLVFSGLSAGSLAILT